MAEPIKIDGLTKAERRSPLVRSSYVIPQSLKILMRTEIDKIRRQQKREEAEMLLATAWDNKARQ